VAGDEAARLASQIDHGGGNLFGLGRPSGIFSKFFLNSGFAAARSSNSVRVKVGDTPTTRIPCGAHSAASERVNEFKPPLAPAYAARSGPPTCLTCELILTIVPLMPR
jgi:hypothetical protein